MVKLAKKGNTKVTEADGMTCVKLHNTIVVRFNASEVILNSGGWKTVTTKARMNQAANEYNLPYQVYQDKGEWYVNVLDKTFTFQDGMIIKIRQIELES